MKQWSTVADRIITRMKSYLPFWTELINQSFLPDRLKDNYHLLLSKRIALL